MSMELKSSPKSGGVSPPDSICDPDEKEISDEDDDDRNHKHRRRETTSQLLDQDPLEQALTQPYRKRSRPFENGQSDTQSHYNSSRDFSKRRLVGSNLSRFPSEHGSGRGRGRDFQHDSWFGSVDVASQMPHPGSMPPVMFSGRGLPVSNTQSGSWGGFGLISSMQNGAIDAMNPLGLPGILGPQMNPSLNIRIQRQRCRDFEERGFCLRGDMCPMEHGVNRIVVEDVQSLSQFNLPVSLPSAHMVGTSAVSGFVPSTSFTASTLNNNRGPQSRTNKSAAGEEALSVVVNTGGADVYDPDQPLWNADGHESSGPLLGVQPSITDVSVSFVDAELPDRLAQSSGDAIGSQSASTTVWGRLHSSRNKLGLKENLHVGKRNNGVPFGPKTVGSTSKLQNEVGGNVRKLSQKAQRTLFVNCIPLKDNKKDNLLSHFSKFGEVVDIYIPANSERAFVQFSKREEAEKALKAPDAVMGSRFIKLWWANRDSIPDESISRACNVSISPHDVMSASESSHPIVTNKGKDVVQYAGLKVAGLEPSDSLLTGGNECKQVAVNSPKAVPLTPKKMESLELLKEELRKKQEMLEQKRNEFRQQLNKLAKQAPGKLDVPNVAADKRQKAETSYDSKAGSTKPSGVFVSRPSQSEVSDKMGMGSHASQRPNADSAGGVQGPLNLKPPVHPALFSGTPLPIYRYKLDNRPTTFRINAPLPARLANITALRDHFSMYGEISNVEIEDLNEENLNGSTYSEEMKNCSARLSFATRHAAERAFLNGKNWHGHNLQLNWVSSSKPASSLSSGESTSALKGTSNAEVQSAEEAIHPNRSHSSPSKSSHELPCDSSRSTSKEKCLEPADAEVQSGEEAVHPNSSHSSPPKSSHELPCDSSRSTDKGKCPQPENDTHEAFQVQSADKSASFIPLEADELGNRDPELLDDRESSGDGTKLDDELGAG